MNKNRFTEKFKTKSDSDLKLIIEQKEKYENIAVNAASEILAKRGIIIELENNNITIDDQPILSNTENGETPLGSESESESINKKYLPEMYSKKTIFIFSTLFTPLSGSVLMSSNLKKLQNTNGQAIVIIFGILFNKVCFEILDYFNLGFSLWIIINIIGAFLLTKYFWNLLVGDDFEYQKRTAKSPFLIILGIISALIIIVLITVVLS